MLDYPWYGFVVVACSAWCTVVVLLNDEASTGVTAIHGVQKVQDIYYMQQWQQQEELEEDIHIH